MHFLLGAIRKIAAVGMGRVEEKDDDGEGNDVNRASVECRGKKHGCRLYGKAFSTLLDTRRGGEKKAQHVLIESRYMCVLYYRTLKLLHMCEYVCMCVTTSFQN